MPRLTILVRGSRGYRVHTLLCRGSGLPIFFLLSPAHAHDAPFAQPRYGMGHAPLSDPSPRHPLGCWTPGAFVSSPGSRACLGLSRSFLGIGIRQKNRSCLPPTWTKEELGKRSGIERFFGRVFLFFHLQRPPLSGWSAIASQVALTYTASIVVALAAQQAHRPDLIRSPKRVLAHLWEENEL